MDKQAVGYVRQRKENLWEGQYVFQKKKRSIYGSSEFEVRRQLQEITKSIYLGEYTRPNVHTVASWFNHWYETYVVTTLRPSVIVNYETIIRRHITPYFGDMLINNVSIDALQEFFNNKQNYGRCDGLPGGLSVKTLKNIKIVLNVAFTQAYLNQLIQNNPMVGVKLPAEDYKEQKFLKCAEKTVVCEFAIRSDSIIAKGTIILLNCGLRKGELLGLRWEDIDLPGNCMHVRGTLARFNKQEVKKSPYKYTQVDQYYAPDDNKTALFLGPVKTAKSNRVIYMPQSVRQAILDIKEIQSHYLQQGERFNPHNFLFCTEDGHPYDPQTAVKHFKQILREAQIDEVNMHATRHTFATEALQKTSDLITISEIMGHTKPSTTLDMYGHTFDDKKRALMSQF